MSLYLPLPGQITRKRRRHWKRQILKNNPGLNPAWLDARYEIAYLYADGTKVMSGIREDNMDDAMDRMHVHAIELGQQNEKT